MKKQGRQTTETACGPRALHCRLALPGTLGWTPFPDAPGWTPFTDAPGWTPFTDAPGWTPSPDALGWTPVSCPRGRTLSLPWRHGWSLRPRTSKDQPEEGWNQLRWTRPHSRKGGSNERCVSETKTARGDVLRGEQKLRANGEKSGW